MKPLAVLVNRDESAVLQQLAFSFGFRWPCGDTKAVDMGGSDTSTPYDKEGKKYLLFSDTDTYMSSPKLIQHVEAEKKKYISNHAIEVSIEQVIEFITGKRTQESFQTVEFHFSVNSGHSVTIVPKKHIKFGCTTLSKSEVETIIDYWNSKTA